MWKQGNIELSEGENSLVRIKIFDEYEYLPCNESQRLKFIASFIAN